MFSNKTFCTLPFSSIQINTSGNFKVCCFTGEITANPAVRGGFQNTFGMTIDNEGKIMNILTHSIEEAMNSETHKSIRLAQSNDEKHPACNVCWVKDDGHDSSYRQIRNRHFRNRDGSINLEDAAVVMSADGSISQLPIALDLRFGNLCNAKCIMCGPHHSNLWYEDYGKIERKPFFHIGAAKYTIKEENGVFKSDMNADVRWWESPIWWEQFERIKHRIRFVYITGGEPFVVPAHDEFLDRLIASGLADKVDLAYDTNLSVINPKIISRLKKFKSINISASMDDIEDRYELIRFPLKWERFIENCKIINKEVKIKEFKLSSVVGIFTAYAPLRFVPYFENLGFNSMVIRTVHYPFNSDLLHLTNEQKQTVIDAYKNTNVGSYYTDFFTNYLTSTRDKQNIKQLESFVSRMDRLDKVRGTEWKATMPDVADLMKDYIK